MADTTCELRMYREIHPHYCAARVEIWPHGARSPRQVDVFAFDDFRALLAFEQWMDATVYLVTGRDPTHPNKKGADRG